MLCLDVNSQVLAEILLSGGVHRSPVGGRLVSMAGGGRATPGDVRGAGYSSVLDLLPFLCSQAGSLSTTRPRLPGQEGSHKEAVPQVRRRVCWLAGTVVIEHRRWAG